MMVLLTEENNNNPAVQMDGVGQGKVGGGGRKPCLIRNSCGDAQGEDEERTRVCSMSSVDSGFEGLENLEPLELGDIRRFSNDVHFGSEDEDEGESGGAAEEIPNNVSLFSVAMMMMDRGKTGKRMPKLPEKHRTRGAQNWLKALRLINKRSPHFDPWEKFHLEQIPVEKAIRHRYNALKKTWARDEVFVKLAKEPFDAGAMRICFRMKKMDKFCPKADWVKDSNNYVAKKYKDDTTSRETYFEDIKLQMDAKLWGEEYNRHNPPKKVDIFMTTVYEFGERLDKALFHVEHFIEGEYIKYNSNSGFVDFKGCRQTPQAFSHFTFESSGHELIVVDIQGVGDLYTDPQIHTAEGKDYGDGNLGARGMALFFHSHQCNSICKQLGLLPFQLSSNEVKKVQEQQNSASSSRSTSKSETVVRGMEMLPLSPNPMEDMSVDIQTFFRNRNTSLRMSGVFEEDSPRSSVSGEGDTGDRSVVASSIRRTQRVRFDSCSSSVSREGGLAMARLRSRRGTEIFSDSFSESETFLNDFHFDVANRKRTANLEDELKLNLDFDSSVLGMVHLELAKYHEMCRFTEDGKYDKEAALFHLKAGADCGIVFAIKTYAYIFCGLPHDLLVDVTWKDTTKDEISEQEAKAIGFEYMERAATAGDREAMVYVARAYDDGLSLADISRRSLARALYWYEEIQEMDELAAGEGHEPEWGLDDPPYAILARQAEILANPEEGSQVRRNPQKAGDLYNAAAESAMSCMKGKLANKYYMLAEEAYALMEDDDENDVADNQDGDNQRPSAAAAVDMNVPIEE